MTTVKLKRSLAAADLCYAPYRNVDESVRVHTCTAFHYYRIIIIIVRTITGWLFPVINIFKTKTGALIHHLMSILQVFDRSHFIANK